MTQITLIAGLFSLFLLVVTSQAAVSGLRNAGEVAPNLITYYHDDTIAYQAEAIAHYCPKEFDATLAAPLIDTEITDFKEYLLLNQLTSKQVLTAGARYNNGPFEWLYTLDKVHTPIRWYPGCGNSSVPSVALCFQADTLDIYGFCECDFSVTYRFVCERDT